MSNKYIVCKDCKRIFILSEWEQKVYQVNDRSLPTICFTCRNERRRQKQESQRIRFTEADYRYWLSIMANRIPARRDTKHPTDDFRGFLSSKRKKAV